MRSAGQADDNAGTGAIRTARGAVDPPPEVPGRGKVRFGLPGGASSYSGHLGARQPSRRCTPLDCAGLQGRKTRLTVYGWRCRCQGGDPDGRCGTVRSGPDPMPARTWSICGRVDCDDPWEGCPWSNRSSDEVNHTRCGPRSGARTTPIGRQVRIGIAWRRWWQPGRWKCVGFTARHEIPIGQSSRKQPSPGGSIRSGAPGGVARARERSGQVHAATVTRGSKFIVRAARSPRCTLGAQDRGWSRPAEWWGLSVQSSATINQRT